MERIEIKEKICELASENSIEIDETGMLLDLDSFAFVSFLVSMEDEFEIVFPDTSLSFSNMNNVETIVRVVSLILEENQ